MKGFKDLLLFQDSNNTGLDNVLSVLFNSVGCIFVVFFLLFLRPNIELNADAFTEKGN